MRFDRVLSAFGFLALSTLAFAGVEKDAWLIRTPLPNPTAAGVADVLGVGVETVEHVTDDLYRIVLDHGESGLLGPVRSEKALLEARIRTRAPGAITRIQQNHIYKIQLDVKAASLKKLHELTTVYGIPEAAAEDNPAVEDPDGHPASGPDPKMSDQWSLGNVHAKDAWTTTRGDKQLVVGVIDTGVDYNHEDLRANLWHNPKAGQDGEGTVGWDAVDNDLFPYDKTSQLRIDGNPGHGTFCAGEIAAVGDNALGISGVAPNVSLMAVRFINDKGEGTTADAVKAIKWAVSHGAKILSNSWGGEKDEEDDTELKQVIQDAQDVLFVFAAGNGRNGVGYDNDNDAKPTVPASYGYANIVAVAATDKNDKLADFSNWGKKGVHLAAPGVKILSSVPGDTYEDAISLFGIPIADWSGTSMAAPHVAGAAALIWSEHPDFTVSEVVDHLLKSVRPTEGLGDKVASGGVLDVQAAVK